MTAPETSVRLVDVADAPALAGHLARDRVAFARWEPPRREGYFTTAGQVERIHHLLDLHRAGSCWPAVILAGEAVVGWVTVCHILRGPFQSGVLGYWVATTAQGRGHARRAVAATLRTMADEWGLHRIEAQTQLENIASQRVLRHNGFTAYGVARSQIFTDGAWQDNLCWERLLSDEPPPAY